MADVCNRMVAEIDSYVKQPMEEQERGRRLEIEALQMQINPHFMYNTLASSKYLLLGEQHGEGLGYHQCADRHLKKTIGNIGGDHAARESIGLVKSSMCLSTRCSTWRLRIRGEYFLAEEAWNAWCPS